MAEGSCLEDKLTCLICVNIYRNPHELTCRHTFCIECINQLQIENQIQCPECREISHMEQVLEDFRLQKIIDTLNNAAPVQVSKLETDPALSEKCGVCEESGLPVKSRCEECNFLICGDCKKTHCHSKHTKKEKSTDCTDTDDKIYDDLRETLKTLQMEKQKIKLKSEELAARMSEVNNSKEEQLQMLQEYQDQFKRELNKRCLDMSRQITDLSDNLLNTCEVARDVYNKTDIEYNSQIQMVTDLSNTTDTMKLLRTGDKVAAEVLERSEELQRKLADVEIPSQSVTFDRGGEFDRELFPQVLVDEDALAELDNLHVLKKE